MKQGNSLSQKLSQKFSPQQMLVATMIQATSEELENLIMAETEKNPVLETSDEISATDGYGSEEVMTDEEKNPTEAGSMEEGNDGDNSLNEEQYRQENGDVDYFEYDDNSPSDNMGRSSEENSWSPFVNYASDTTSVEDLHRQVNELEIDAEEQFLAHYIIDSLDGNGYLRRPMSELCFDLELSQHFETTSEKLEQVLVDVVQDLEPTGIGARDLRECMLLQLQEEKSSPEVLLAYAIVDQCFDDLFKKAFDRIRNKMQVDERQLAGALRVIAHVNPKPGGMIVGTDRMEIRAAQIKPDFSIHAEDGELVVQLLDGHLPSVRISRDYQQLLEQWQAEKELRKSEKEGATFLRDNINSAGSFIEALRQRRNTLLRVIKVIAALQREYFLSGGNTDLLRPMVLQDVADRSGFDISTISRVSNSKYIDSDFGIFPVRDLFTTGIATGEGDVISNEAIKNALKQLIDEEEKRTPLADEALAKLLNEKGYPVARRTVAKYREALGYPTAKMRKEI